MTRKGTIEKGSRTALVTGAGSGIGRCMARRLAELGYRLILAGLDPAKLEAAAEELHEQYGLAVEVIPIDLARPEAAHELFERVQGAGSGIGRCMARRLAELGYRLILAGLDPAKLEAAAEELHEQYGLAVEVIPIDLARPEAAHELFERVQALGREVDVLVNNAGAFSFRDILQTPVERIERILCLHALTTTLTCRLFGAEMSRRGCGGHILNMASYSLWMPWPGLALYSASKSYLRGFSVAFAKEVREQNIRVTAVCPAGVATDLYGLPPRWQRIGLRLGVLITPDSCARRALKALWRGRRCCVPGWWNRLFIPFCRLMPMCVLRVARKYTMKLQR